MLNHLAMINLADGKSMTPSSLSKKQRPHPNSPW